MTEAQDKLHMRAEPKRRIVRFKKGVVIGGAAVASAGLLGVTMLALQTPNLRTGQPAEELYNTDKKPTPDGLAALPGDYSEIKLGPPLPGDLGRPILERQRQLGIAPGGQELSAAEQRLASQAIQAKESTVFFRIENRPQQNAPAATPQPMQMAAVQPDADRLTQARFPEPAGHRRHLQPPCPANPGLAVSGDGRERHCRQPDYRHQFRPSGSCRRSGDRKCL